MTATLTRGVLKALVSAAVGRVAKSGSTTAATTTTVTRSQRLGVAERQQEISVSEMTR